MNWSISLKRWDPHLSSNIWHVGEHRTLWPLGLCNQETSVKSGEHRTRYLADPVSSDTLPLPVQSLRRNLNAETNYELVHWTPFWTMSWLDITDISHFLVLYRMFPNGKASDCLWRTRNSPQPLPFELHPRGEQEKTEDQARLHLLWLQ